MRGGAALLPLALAVACDPPPQPTVLVTLPRVPAGTLQVSVTLDGVPASGAPGLFTGPPQRFAVQLPAGKRGRLQIDARVLGTTGCAAALGRTEVPVNSDDTTAIDLPLAGLARRAITPAPEAPMVPLGDLRAVWGAHADDVWVAGTEGAQHLIKGQVTPPRLPGNLLGLWGSAAGVWAVGDSGGDIGAIQRFDGAAWAKTPLVNSKALTALWGFGADDIVAVGIDVTVRGGQAQALSGSLFGVWGSAAGELWAAGAKGLLRDAGQGLTPVAGAPLNLARIYGTGPEDFWISGDDGVLLQGRALRPASLSSAGDLRGIGGSGPRDLWTVSTRGETLHYDGARWSCVENEAMGRELRGVQGWPAAGRLGDVVIVGSGGTVLQLTPL